MMLKGELYVVVNYKGNLDRERIVDETISALSHQALIKDVSADELDHDDAYIENNESANRFYLSITGYQKVCTWDDPSVGIFDATDDEFIISEKEICKDLRKYGTDVVSVQVDVLDSELVPDVASFNFA